MRHPFNILNPSPWPLFFSLTLLSIIISFIGILNGILMSNKLIILSIISFFGVIYLWFQSLIIESTYLGLQSNRLILSLIVGFLLFLLTEIMVFFSLFWAYFHSALNPTFLMWPPIGISLINPWAIPLFNTLLLLYSGIFATWAHHSFLSHNKSTALIALIITISLGILFFIFQLFEYFNSLFDISDSVYGSSFFILTGTHGLHVIIGIIFIFIAFLKIYNSHNSTLIFDLSLLYWHFVDIVWILLFILIYYLAY